MAQELFTISRRPGWSWLGEIQVTIECDPLAPQPVKLGLAVKAAFANRARLDGASLDGASLVGARLDGALVRGEKVSRLIASVSRLEDPYVFYAFELQEGGVKVLAGCRWFTVSDYRAHVAEDYPDTDKGHETLDILDFIEARAKRLGVDLEPPAQAEAA